MSEVLKIAIIGDYNFTYNSHHATNLSLDHASDFLEIEVNYYWIKINEAIQHKRVYFEQFDGIWIAPGPFLNHFFLNGVFKLVLESNVPGAVNRRRIQVFLRIFDFYASIESVRGEIDF